LSYKKEGKKITVGEIPKIALGTQTNPISLTLEQAVPYEITLTPSCPGVSFSPTTVIFNVANGGFADFSIIPGTFMTEGEYKITWGKVENFSPNNFSELPQTTFNVVKTPDENALK